MGHHDAVHQLHSDGHLGLLSRYQLVSTYRAQYYRVLVTVVSESALDLQMYRRDKINQMNRTSV